MKSVLKKALVLLLLLLINISCKKENKDDSVKSSHSLLSKQDTVVTSLDSLIDHYYSLYEKDSLKDNDIQRENILDQIKALSTHEISYEEYRGMRDKFWGNKTVYKLPITVTNLKKKLKDGASKGMRYMQIVFTSSTSEANDISYDMVKDFAFNTFVSCHAIPVLNEYLNDSESIKLKQIAIVKSKTNLDTNQYKGEYCVATIVLLYKDKSEKYLDIVHDPTPGIRIP